MACSSAWLRKPHAQLVGLRAQHLGQRHAQPVGLGERAHEARHLGHVDPRGQRRSAPRAGWCRAGSRAASAPSSSISGPFSRRTSRCSAASKLMPGLDRERQQIEHGGQLRRRSCRAGRARARRSRSAGRGRRRAASTSPPTRPTAGPTMPGAGGQKHHEVGAQRQHQLERRPPPRASALRPAGGGQLQRAAPRPSAPCRRAQTRPIWRSTCASRRRADRRAVAVAGHPAEHRLHLQAAAGEVAQGEEARAAEQRRPRSRTRASELLTRSPSA